MMEIVKIFELYDEIPEYIVSIDMSGIEIAYENPNGEKGVHRFVYDDVRLYFENYNDDFVSSMRSIGPVIGDHKAIDYLANELHNLFMQLDPDGYRAAYKTSLLDPKW